MSARKTIAAAVLVTAASALLSCTQQPPDPRDPRVAQFASLPDWRGIWVGEGLEPEISGFPSSGTDSYKLIGFSAPWNDAGRAKFEAIVASQGDRKATGWGYPMMMSSAAPMQFVITPEETLLVNMYREVRHIYTDGRGHPPETDRWITTWGDSVGHWEGDTLVIDTIWVRDPLKFFFFVPPLSEDAHYVERLRKTGPDRIESEVTIEDPATLTEPWVVKVAYTRTSGIDRLVHDDFANDRSELEDGVFTILPPRE